MTQIIRIATQRTLFIMYHIAGLFREGEKRKFGHTKQTRYTVYKQHYVHVHINTL